MTVKLAIPTTIASAVRLLTLEFSTLSTKDANLFRVTTKPT